MENYFKPINSEEFKRILLKETFNLDDIKIISKFIPTPLEKEFETPLKPEEEIEVSTLVCRNIYLVVQVYHSIFNNNANDYLISKEFLKTCKDEVGDDESKLIPLKVAYIFANGNGSKHKFLGKIPSRGFFCKRQSIANDWINNYINHFGWHIISNVLSKSGLNKEYALISSAEFTACFLVNTYPNRFRNETPIFEIIENISKM